MRLKLAAKLLLQRQVATTQARGTVTGIIKAVGDAGLVRQGVLPGFAAAVANKAREVQEVTSHQGNMVHIIKERLA